MTLRPAEKLSRWIEKAISDPSAGERLPTVRELSRRFGVSVSSVQHKLRPYVADGRLTAIRGRGLFVTSRMEGVSEPVAAHSATSAESIAEAIAEDIATGRLKYGEALPALKLVSKQFKTAHPNVTRAYRILARRGLARKVGRNFWVGGLQSIRSFGRRGTIACFNFSEGDPSDLAAETPVRKAFSAMEHELHNHRLRIRFENPAKLDLFLRPDAFARSEHAGVCICGITAKRYANLHPLIAALGPVLSRTGKKILLCGVHARRPRNAHYFCHGTIITNVVRTAADYCTSRSFQDIVLIFREDQEDISNVRFLFRFISEMLVRNPHARIMFLIQARRPGQSAEEIFKRTASFRVSGHFEYLEGLLSKYRPMTMPELYKVVTIGEDIDDLLRRAPRGSMWLCGTADTARACLGWCESRRVSIPSETAILCFDENPSLSLKGIASCVPDWHTIGYLMAHALIGDIPIRKSRKGYLRTPAVLFQRDTMP